MMFSGALVLIDVPCHPNVNKFIAKRENKLVVYFWCLSAPVTGENQFSSIAEFTGASQTNPHQTQKNAHGDWILTFQAAGKREASASPINFLKMWLASYSFVRESWESLRCVMTLIQSQRPKAKQRLKLWTNINDFVLYHNRGQRSEWLVQTCAEDVLTTEQIISGGKPWCRRYFNVT